MQDYKCKRLCWLKQHGDDYCSAMFDCPTWLPIDEFPGGETAAAAKWVRAPWLDGGWVDEGEKGPVSRLETTMKTDLRSALCSLIRQASIVYEDLYNG